MRKVTSMLCVIAMLMAVSCKHAPKEMSRDELFATIDSIEKPLMQDAQLQAVDSVQGRQLVDLYVRFADAFPEDSLTPAYLHRAAQVCNGMGQFDDMANYYDRVIDNYGDYQHLDECYYEKGIALDNAGRKDAARDAYQQFLDNYTDHFLTEDIRRAMSLLDMSDELLIEYIKNNAQQNQ